MRPLKVAKPKPLTTRKREFLNYLITFSALSMPVKPFSRNSLLGYQKDLIVVDEDVPALTERLLALASSP